MTPNAKLLLVAFSLLVFLAPVSLAKESASEEMFEPWKSGTYWTYDAERAYGEEGAQPVQGAITVAVLGEDGFLGMKQWALAAIRDGLGGSKVLTVFQLIGSPHDYLRWPEVAEFLPGAKTVSSGSPLIYLASMMALSLDGHPVRIEKGSSVIGDPAGISEPWRIDWLDDEAASGLIAESVMLVPGEPMELVFSAGSFPDAIPLTYTWGRSPIGTQEEPGGVLSWRGGRMLKGTRSYPPGREGTSIRLRSPSGAC